MNLRHKRLIEDKRCNICGRINPSKTINSYIISSMEDWKLVTTFEACDCGHKTETYIFITYYYLIQNLVHLHDYNDMTKSLTSALFMEYVVRGIILKNVSDEADIHKYLRHPGRIFIEQFITDDMLASVHLTYGDYDRLYQAVMIAQR